MTTSSTSGPISRRAFAFGAVGVGVGALAACGTAGAPAAPGKSGESAGAAGSAGGQWTPTTVEHKYGTTTVSKEPTRVVSVGVTEQDFLLALGVVPVGITDWYGDQPYATWPWARAALGGAKPTVLTDSDGIQFAEIAKLRPNLIVGLNSGMEQADYDKLSKIAPTIAPPKDSAGYFGSWKNYLDVLGVALGKKEQAAKIKADIEKKFADAAAQNPKFAKSKAIFLQNAVSDGNFIASQEGLSTDFLTDLGFAIPTDINKFVREGEQAFIPVENITVLNSADVLIWGTEKDADKVALEKVPGFTDLSAVKNDHAVYTGGELAGAIYFSSPLSLTYVVDKLVPQLSKALA